MNDEIKLEYWFTVDIRNNSVSVDLETAQHLDAFPQKNTSVTATIEVVANHMKWEAVRPLELLIAEWKKEAIPDGE